MAALETECDRVFIIPLIDFSHFEEGGELRAPITVPNARKGAVIADDTTRSGQRRCEAAPAAASNVVETGMDGDRGVAAIEL